MSSTGRLFAGPFFAAHRTADFAILSSHSIQTHQRANQSLCRPFPEDPADPNGSRSCVRFSSADALH
jgi:hypothetical protein